MRHGVSYDSEGDSRNEKSVSGAHNLIYSTLLAMTLVLSGCDSKSFDSPAFPNKSGSGSLHSMFLDSLDVTDLRKHFESNCAAIKKKYGITVKIADASDILYVLQNIRTKKDKTHFIPMGNIDKVRWVRINDMIQVLQTSLSVYDEDFIKILKTVHITKNITDAGWFALANGTDTHEELGNNSIVLESDFDGLEYVKVTVDHEIAHILRLNRQEPWPFVSPNLGDNHTGQPDFPIGFARSYGTANIEEDIATIGEGLMSFFGGTEPNYNLINRAKTDPMLSQKIMFMTGSYFDATKGEFTRDFTLKEFREYFQLPDLKELPFYARMRKKGKFDYAFWNMYINPGPILADNKLVTGSVYDAKPFKTGDDDR